jgi:plastocyanin
VVSLRKAALIGPALLALTFLIACSDEGDGDAVGTRESAAPAGAIQPQPEPVQTLDAIVTEATDGTIGISARTAAYHGNNLRIAVGQATTIRVDNGDAQPHNLRIAGVDGQYDTEDDAVTTPETIAGGEQGEVVFAPQVPGAYTFRCDFHPGSMGGRINVE